MQDHQPSALDRFVWDRLPAILGAPLGSGAAGKALLVTGGSQFVAGLALLIFAIVVISRGGDALGPLIAGSVLTFVGAVLGGVGVTLERRAKRSTMPRAKLTLGGQRMLLRIANHIGWSRNHNAASCQIRMTRIAVMRAFGFGPRTASDVLTPMAFDLLEAAAYEHNRVQGLVRAESAMLNPTLERIGPNAKVAIENAMVAVANQVATIESHPESGEALARSTMSEIAAMRELAQRMEALAVQEPTITERFSARPGIESLLEQLRLDEMARQELMGESPSRADTVDELQ